MARDGSPVHQALIAKALERFHAELGPAETQFMDVSSPEELLAEARSLEASYRGRMGATGSLFRLETTLSNINDFAAFVALGHGMQPQVTGVIWGSLKLIFMLMQKTSETFEDVLRMLDEMSLALPRFKAYADSLEMTPELESCLVEVYTEMTCFCARVVKFFRSSPHRFLVREGWPYLNGDFKQTLTRLKTLSQSVDREANAIRLRKGSIKNAELVEAMDAFKIDHGGDNRLPCHYLPKKASKTFFGRQDAIQAVRQALTGQHNGIQCVLLHGLGGVGKSTLAMHFANTAKTDFDAILWVPADEMVKVQQAFLGFAQQLGIIASDDNSNEASLAVGKVKDWLSSSGCRWLMILDNVENSEVLDHVWPESVNGSVLITARNSQVNFGIPSSSIALKPFDADTGKAALLSLSANQNASLEEQKIADELVETLGGLPLAINHISGFMKQQRLGLTDFLRVYKKNADRVDKRVLNQGEQTISTIWEMALSSLPPLSSQLINLLALMDPDSVNEKVITDILDEELNDGKSSSFLDDEMDFIDAKTPLLDNALIDRNAAASTLSMHRLVQSAVLGRLKEHERSEIFDTAVKLLGDGFPNTWNVVTVHQHATWSQCGMRVAHVEALIHKYKTYKIQSSKVIAFIELIFRFAWYLYERELYDDSQRLLDTGLAMLETKDTLMYAAAVTLRGLLELDTGRVGKSLESFLEGYNIRIKVMDPDDEFIASSLNAISLAYTELNQLSEAKQMGDKAIGIRRRIDSERIGNSYSNMASTLLRLGQPDEAEAMLKSCPSLRNFTDETFLQSGNPRFAGDMVLLSRIREAQVRAAEAMRLAAKALTFRQTVHGNRLKTCDSLQLVGAMLDARGDTSSAIYMFKQSASIAESLPYGDGFVARANYGLSRMHAASGATRESELCKKAAVDARARFKMQGSEAFTDEECEAPGYLTPWMLW